jgi:hypothetical protein
MGSGLELDQSRHRRPPALLKRSIRFESYSRPSPPISMRQMMMSASPGGGGGDGGDGAAVGERSELGGGRQSIAEFRSTEMGGSYPGFAEVHRTMSKEVTQSSDASQHRILPPLTFGGSIAQSIDENIHEPKDVLLPTWLVVRVAHAHDRSQQVFRADVTADFTGRNRLLQQQANRSRQPIG